MPNWDTNFDRLLVKHDPRGCMELIVASCKVMGIPRTGTKWSAHEFGVKVAVFAEWTVDDEIADGFYE